VCLNEQRSTWPDGCPHGQRHAIAASILLSSANAGRLFSAAVFAAIAAKQLTTTGLEVYSFASISRIQEPTKTVRVKPEEALQVARHCQDIDLRKCRLQELRTFAREMGVPVSGRKIYLAERVEAFIAKILHANGKDDGATNDKVEEWARRLVASGGYGTACEKGLNDELQKCLLNSPELSSQIRDSQLDAVIFSLRRGGRALIADEMGAGKTLISIAISLFYAEEWPLLIVAPAGVISNWQSEVRKWLPHLSNTMQLVTKSKEDIDPKKDIVIMSYDLIARNEHFQRRHDGEAYRVVVLDEAHFIKNKDSRRADQLFKVCRNATRCTLLTGTPVLNAAYEVWSLLQALVPDTPPFDLFCERYSRHTRVKENGKEMETRWHGAKNEEELHQLLSTIMLRRLKKDVLPNLPKKRRIVQQFQQSNMSLKSASQIENAIKKANILAREAAERGAPDNSNYSSNLLALRAPDNIRDLLALQIWSITGRAKAAAVTTYVTKLLQEKEKVVVFAHHRTVLNAVGEKLSKSGIKFIRIDGKVSAQNRGELVQQFQEFDEIRVAILALTAGCHGISLTAAHTVVMAELHWVPGKLLQAEDRVHRQGQMNDVEIHYCIAPEDGNYSDKAMLLKLLKKESIMDDLVDGSRKPSSFKALR